MSYFKLSAVLLLASLVACSSGKVNPSRTFASMDEVLNDSARLQKNAENLTSGIFHAYLIGQVALQDFDNALNRDPKKAMNSKSYHTLLSVRTFVDQFEHDFIDLYRNLVLASALPRYSTLQKKNAQLTLDTFGNFMDGIRSDSKKLPENLKPLILSNLREKLTLLYEELKAIHDDTSITQNDAEVKEIIHQNMVLLRATRRLYFKELQNYKVDPGVLADAIKEEKKKKSYQNLEREISELSKEMKAFTSELGRGTSSGIIFPSAGPNGNLSGKSFPQNTWSLTYDDGPAKSTDQVVTNLLERKIPATFFMLAQQTVAHPAIFKRIKDNGFDVASHSYTHAQLTKVGAVQLEKEIGTSSSFIAEKLGKPVKLFRLPYGAGVSVANVRAKIAEHKLIHVFWNVDTLDWQDKNPQTILARTIKQMEASPKNSGIILFHDIHAQSVIASTLLMDHFNKKGLIVCTVQGVVDQLNDASPTCKTE